MFSLSITSVIHHLHYPSTLLSTAPLSTSCIGQMSHCMCQYRNMLIVTYWFIGRSTVLLYVLPLSCNIHCYRLVDWLDECLNVSFRQAQFSFSSRLPKMFPIHDASSMASNVLLACSYSRHDVKSLYSGTNPLRVAGDSWSNHIIIFCRAYRQDA